MRKLKIDRLVHAIRDHFSHTYGSFELGDNRRLYPHAKRPKVDYLLFLACITGVGIIPLEGFLSLIYRGYTNRWFGVDRHKTSFSMDVNLKW